MRRSVQSAAGAAKASMAVMRAAWVAHPAPQRHRTTRPARSSLEAEDGEAQADNTRLVSHAEGYYWLAEGDREVGPFPSIEAALADMGASGDDDDGLAPEDTLAEVEDELGMSTWIDPDTGSPAEATWTRLEDH